MYVRSARTGGRPWRQAEISLADSASLVRDMSNARHHLRRTNSFTGQNFRRRWRVSHLLCGDSHAYDSRPWALPRMAVPVDNRRAPKASPPTRWPQCVMPPSVFGLPSLLPAWSSAGWRYTLPSPPRHRRSRLVHCNHWRYCHHHRSQCLPADLLRTFAGLKPAPPTFVEL